MPRYTKLSTYVNTDGMIGLSAAQSDPAGGCNSRIMIVIRIATTPSLNASIRCLSKKVFLVRRPRESCAGVVNPAKERHPRKSGGRGRESMFTRHSRESGNPCSPVIPAKAGIHVIGFWILRQHEADRQQMDSRFRGNDDIPHHPLSRE